MTRLTAITKADRQALSAIFRAAGLADKAKAAKSGAFDKLEVMAILAEHRESAAAMSQLAGRELVAKVRRECADVLEAAIDAGYDSLGDARAQCEHGRFGWEDCIACYDVSLMAVVSRLRMEVE